MTEPLSGPRPQILDGLAGRRRIELAEQMVASHDAQHLDVDHVRAA
jgi:hypothetical protein